MDCVDCKKKAGYNRAVVDIFSGTDLGGLCVKCERELFGKILAMGVWEDECILCNRDGQFALPKWESNPVKEGDHIISKAGYEVKETTPVLCDEHYQRLIAPETNQTIEPMTKY